MLTQELVSTMTTLALFNDLLAPSHLIVILVIALLVFGNRLPDVGRGLGRSITEFKKGLREVNDDVVHPQQNISTPARIEQPRVEQRLPNNAAQNPYSGSSQGGVGPTN